MSVLNAIGKVDETVLEVRLKPCQPVPEARVAPRRDVQAGRVPPRGG